MSAFEVSLSPSGLSGAQLVRAAGRFDDGITAGIEAAGRTFLRAAQVAVQHIYDRRIPTVGEVRAYNRARRGGGSYAQHRMAGRGVAGSSREAWRRTRQTQRGIYMEAAAMEAAIGVRGGAAASIRNWPSGYAHRRHQLGVAWKPKAPALGIVRYDPYFLIATRSDVVFAATNAFAEAFNRTVMA